ncbi:hypothetical protein B0T24DRAFT_192430 [Lasiosphaeria ovina]|uniref:Uncharacterized protein n=1 Tax=Lasiosphaeria ovina TaxID=92902 RepID=A0AAE0NFB5_9PEZI|nr:hypothetical protein B0T24DRAFT_192430 [Lasiosphaeria ovina]
MPIHSSPGCEGQSLLSARQVLSCTTANPGARKFALRPVPPNRPIPGQWLDKKSFPSSSRRQLFPSEFFSHLPAPSRRPDKFISDRLLLLFEFLGLPPFLTAVSFPSHVVGFSHLSLSVLFIGHLLSASSSSSSSSRLSGCYRCAISSHVGVSQTSNWHRLLSSSYGDASSSPSSSVLLANRLFLSVFCKLNSFSSLPLRARQICPSPSEEARRFESKRPLNLLSTAATPRHGQQAIATGRETISSRLSCLSFASLSRPSQLRRRLSNFSSRLAGI